MQIKERRPTVVKPGFTTKSPARESILPRIPLDGKRGVGRAQSWAMAENFDDVQAVGAWKSPSTMVGVRGADIEDQFDFLEFCCPPELVERLKRNDIYSTACYENGEPGFNPIDADFLHCFIRTVQPNKIVQVGSGVSTSVILNAAAISADYTPEIVCIDPNPSEFLKRAHRSGRIRLVHEKPQSIAIEELTRLGENGFLFVDSAHSMKPGNGLNRMIFEVLPRLEPGTWVHLHNIHFPYDHQRGILDDELYINNESVLLHAFLIDNSRFTIRLSQSMLQDAHPGRLARSMPNYRPFDDMKGARSTSSAPASIYLQTF